MQQLLRRFFLLVLLAGLAAPIATMVMLEPLSGDLTRISFLPEREFGWNAAQPSLLRRTSNATDAEATVLVLGDSFSEKGLWQAVALDAREKYVTYLHRRICSDFARVAQGKALALNAVVVETVERSFNGLFFSPCKSSVLLTAPANGLSPGPTTRERSILNGAYGIKYAVGSIFYYLLAGEQFRSGDRGGVFIKRVPDGCSLFSNRDCGHGLFLGDDFNQPLLPQHRFKSPVFGYLRDAGAKRIVVVVIPNKTSVYFQSLAEARLKDAYLTEFGIQNGVEVVTLNEGFLQDRRRAMDFYLPNDTHLSPRGFEVLGNYIEEHFRR